LYFYIPLDTTKSFLFLLLFKSNGGSLFFDPTLKELVPPFPIRPDKPIESSPASEPRTALRLDFIPQQA
jgi:hypothetical protein